jgi:hypothetical protein
MKSLCLAVDALGSGAKPEGYACYGISCSSEYHKFSMRACATYSSIDFGLDHDQPDPAYDTFLTPTLNVLELPPVGFSGSWLEVPQAGWNYHVQTQLSVLRSFR